jgi:cytochrome P450
VEWGADAVLPIDLWEYSDADRTYCQIGQIPFAHKFLLGNPLLPKLFPAIEKTNQVLQFSLARVEERQKNPLERKDILNQLLETHRADPASLSLDEIIAITTTNV